MILYHLGSGEDSGREIASRISEPGYSLDIRLGVVLEHRSTNAKVNQKVEQRIAAHAAHHTDGVRMQDGQLYLALCRNVSCLRTSPREQDKPGITKI